jgi:pyruvate/2-oxoglutarate dehydrogenase complex dihydrolipoamide dehydrogenase (E3) component
MNKQEYDLFVIGTGMSGMITAIKCAKKGMKVGITDFRPYGGTCALRGCDPKKIRKHALMPLCYGHFLSLILVS